MFRYTPEQGDLVDYILEEDGIVLVEAGAGTGKSTMAKQIVKELNPSSGIYTAFNKAIVVEGIKRFEGTKMECSTFHAMAYKYVKPTKSIEDLTYRCIKEEITYSDKYSIITAIDQFFVSDSCDMYEYMSNFFKDRKNSQKLAEIAVNYIEQMLDDKINPTFNFMLKYLHMAMDSGDITIEVDLVILDEINDVTAVSLEIFRLIKAPKKVGLGETHQAIYQFLNLVNGFEILGPEAETKRLTQSYRCSEEIAYSIEKTMKNVLDPNFKFVGTDNPCANGKSLFCTSTNSSIILEIFSRINKGLGFNLLRNVSDIFAAPLAVLTASQGKKPYQRKYGYLVDVYKEYTEQSKHKNFFSFLVNELDDEEISNAVSVIKFLQQKGVNIFSIYKDAKNHKVDDSYTIATVFTSKGLEYETVTIADDLNSRFDAAIFGKLGEEEALTVKRLYYVACSRAGVNLNNATGLL